MGNRFLSSSDCYCFFKGLFFYRDLCEESDTFSAPANAICQRLGTELFQAYLHHTRLQDEEYTKDFNKVLSILFLRPRLLMRNGKAIVLANLGVALHLNATLS